MLSEECVYYAVYARSRLDVKLALALGGRKMISAGCMHARVMAELLCGPGYPETAVYEVVGLRSVVLYAAYEWGPKGRAVSMKATDHLSTDAVLTSVLQTVSAHGDPARHRALMASLRADTGGSSDEQ